MGLKLNNQLVPSWAKGAKLNGNILSGIKFNDVLVWEKATPYTKTFNFNGYSYKQTLEDINSNWDGNTLYFKMNGSGTLLLCDYDYNHAYWKKSQFLETPYQSITANIDFNQQYYTTALYLHFTTTTENFQLQMRSGNYSTNAKIYRNNVLLTSFGMGYITQDDDIKFSCTPINNNRCIIRAFKNGVQEGSATTDRITNGYPGIGTLIVESLGSGVYWESVFMKNDD